MLFTSFTAVLHIYCSKTATNDKNRGILSTIFSSACSRVTKTTQNNFFVLSILVYAFVFYYLYAVVVIYSVVVIYNS